MIPASKRKLRSAKQHNKFERWIYMSSKICVGGLRIMNTMNHNVIVQDAIYVEDGLGIKIIRIGRLI